ncbi:MAG TPA: 16S rRNA (guanine(527)-N(7))-methyltransferase RsmG [Tepidisphaeraceae bacterium]|jgi:16S rRNA (guanine527-N7)-methyltransferase
MEPNLLWNDIAARAGLSLRTEQHALLHRYLDLLLQANQRMNLTRITDRTAAEVQHVGDALTLLQFVPSGAISLSDVGSGGGVPGIPLAIARPDVRMLLIESTKKKASFLREAGRTLNLTNVTITDTRAEDVARHTPQRESFDIVTARAVGTLAWLAEWCLPLAKVGGKVLAMKGAKLTEELPLAAKAIKLLGGGEPVIHPVQLPGAEHHVIVEIPKLAKTDLKFPRDPTATRGKAIA